MYYVYLIQDNSEGKSYIGYTNDLRRMLKEHQRKEPELLYYEAYKDIKDAQLRERKLKQRGQAVRWLKNRLKYSLLRKN